MCSSELKNCDLHCEIVRPVPYKIASLNSSFASHKIELRCMKYAVNKILGHHQIRVQWSNIYLGYRSLKFTEESDLDLQATEGCIRTCKET